MRGMVRSAVLLLGLAMLLWGVGLAQASTIQGTAIQMPALDQGAATVDAQARGNGGKIFSYVLMGGGLFTFASGFHSVGALGFLAGGAGAFIPGTAGNLYDNAPAATLADLAQRGLSAMQQVVDGMAGMHLARDPVVWGSLFLTLGLLYGVRQWQARQRPMLVH